MMQGQISNSERRSINKAFYKACVHFLKQNKDTIKIPVMTLGLMLVLWVWVVIFGFEHFNTILSISENANMSTWIYVGAAFLCYYLLTIFIVLAANATLFEVIYKRLQGEACTLKVAFKRVLKRWPSLLGWSLISATVGTILNALERSHRVVAEIAALLLNVAWGVATFFVIPVMIAQGVGPIAAIKDSGKLIQKGWRRTFRLMGPIYFVFALIMVASFVLAQLFPFEHKPLFIVGGIVLVGLVLFSATFGRVYAAIAQSAIYLQLTTGETPKGFSQEMLTNAFGPRKRLIIQ